MSEPRVEIRYIDGDLDEVVAPDFHMEVMDDTLISFSIGDSYFHVRSKNGRSHIEIVEWERGGAVVTVNPKEDDGSNYD